MNHASPESSGHIRTGDGITGVTTGPRPASPESPGLICGIGLWQATALNVTFIVGSGVFATIPFMLGLLPGPYALLAWLVAGGLILLDGLVWSELGAAFPRSGGSYQYLLECYGRDRWGRLMAFLFVWQFLLSGPLELGTNLVAIAQFAAGSHPDLAAFDARHSVTYDLWQTQGLAVTFSPSRLFSFVVGLGILALLYRRVTTLGYLAVGLWVALLAVIGWILVEGALRFRADVAFDFTGDAATTPPDLGLNLGRAMTLAVFSYLGYYNVCHFGEEVREPARVIPRAILISAAIVIALFVGLHLAMLGVVSWKSVPKEPQAYNLAAEFMRLAHGEWAATAVSLLLIGVCVASSFSGLLGYSRIPYGAAREGHFFAAFDRLHPGDRFPHRSLLLVGGLTLLWTFFDLQVVIDALITTRLLEMFCGQIIGLMLLRWRRPDAPRPWKMVLYPLPCLLALGGWVYLYVTAKWVFMALGAGTLATGVVAFLLWSWRRGEWPFRREANR